MTRLRSARPQELAARRNVVKQVLDDDLGARGHADGCRDSYVTSGDYELCSGIGRTLTAAKRETTH